MLCVPLDLSHIQKCFSVCTNHMEFDIPNIYSRICYCYSYIPFIHLPIANTHSPSVVKKDLFFPNNVDTYILAQYLTLSERPVC